MGPPPEQEPILSCAPLSGASVWLKPAVLAIVAVLLSLGTADSVAAPSTGGPLYGFLLSIAGMCPFGLQLLTASALLVSLWLGLGIARVLVSSNAGLAAVGLLATWCVCTLESAAPSELLCLPLLLLPLRELLRGARHTAFTAGLCLGGLVLMQATAAAFTVGLLLGLIVCPPEESTPPASRNRLRAQNLLCGLSGALFVLLPYAVGLLFVSLPGLAPPFYLLPLDRPEPWIATDKTVGDWLLFGARIASLLVLMPLLRRERRHAACPNSTILPLRWAALLGMHALLLSYGGQSFLAFAPVYLLAALFLMRACGTARLETARLLPFALLLVMLLPFLL